MNNTQGSISCALGCWLVAALGGALAAVLLWVLGGWSFMQGAFAGIVVAAVAGLLLTWIMCRPLPAAGAAEVGQKDDAAQKADAARAAAEARSADAAAAPTATATPATATPATATAAETKPAVVASKPLAGQQELAERKGEWKYEGDDAAPEASIEAPSAADAPAEKPKAKAKPKPKAKAKEAAPVAEGAGTKPETLSAARDGGPDNLKQIKGVGPKLEALLHSMGFYHFDQVASWGANEVAWVDQNLEGFKGRVTRDEWVSQAKILAEGGTTEFSSKVKKGGVY